MTSSLTELRPPPTFPAEPPARIRRQPSTIGYWIAAFVAVVGLTAAFVWGAVGTSNALDQIDTFDRVAVPGQMTVSVTDPGTLIVYYEGPAVQGRYADPSANYRTATRWNPATDATIEVRYAATTPTWPQLRLQVTGPDGRLVPVSTYRSTTRYDLTAGQLGRAVARFEAATAGHYRVSATRATETGATLAVGGNFARDIAVTALGASVLGLVTVLAAVLVAVITYQARSRTTGAVVVPPDQERGPRQPLQVLRLQRGLPVGGRQQSEGIPPGLLPEGLPASIERVGRRHAPPAARAVVPGSSRHHIPGPSLGTLPALPARWKQAR